MSEEKCIKILRKLLSSENEYRIFDKYLRELPDEKIRKLESAVNKAIKILTRKRCKNGI